MVHSILFDLDGTLVDSAYETMLILNAMREELGQSPLPESSYRKLISYGAKTLIQYAVGGEGPETDSYVMAFRERYRKIRTPASSLYPGVSETLATLQQQGVKLGVCTNKPDYLSRNVLRDTGLHPFFSTVVAGGTVERLKPHREPVDKAVSELKTVHKHVLFVGDSTVDQRAAEASGVPFVFFSSGYDDGVDEATAYAKISRMEQLLSVIRNHRSDGGSGL